MAIVIFLAAVVGKTVEAYALTIYEVTYRAVDVDTGQQINEHIEFYDARDGGVITGIYDFGSGWDWGYDDIEQYQITYSYVSCDTSFPVTVTSDMTITQYYDATYYDVSGLGGTYGSLEEMYAAREAAAATEAPTPAPTEPVPEDGWYTIELWGAQGGCDNAYVDSIWGIDRLAGGMGGYVSADVYLYKDEVLYINVGGGGNNAGNSLSAHAYSATGALLLDSRTGAGWNGGGAPTSSSGYGPSGGGYYYYDGTTATNVPGG